MSHDWPWSISIRTAAFYKVYSHSSVPFSWWRHQMETSSALLALWGGNSSVTGEFPTQRSVTQSFGVFFGLPLNERLNKQSWRWWFETPSRPLWRHCNVSHQFGPIYVTITCKTYHILGCNQNTMMFTQPVFGERKRAECSMYRVPTLWHIFFPENSLIFPWHIPKFPWRDIV